MRKHFHLPLLAALPAILAACDEPNARAQNVYQEQRECAWFEDDDTHGCYEDDDGLSLKSKKPSSHNSGTYAVPGITSAPKYSKPRTGVSRGGLATSPRSSGSVGG